MRKHWQYLKYVLRHKWFVFLYCLQYGLVWRGIKHDWTKFLPSEWLPYVEYFHGKKEKTGRIVSDANGLHDEMLPPEHVREHFDRAWNHHQKRNRHHWQDWLLSPDKSRPNFWNQSYDGGMTHVYISRHDGKPAAIIWQAEIDWWKVDPEVESQILGDLRNTPVPLNMPMADRKEMLADWRGAGRALGKPKVWEWYEQNKESIFLHPDTRLWVEMELAVLKKNHEQLEHLRRIGVPI
jgi:hypothetical protein